MFEEEIVKLSNQEQKQFAQVVNNLLSQSYIVREYYDSREKMIKMSNDYRFIERYYEVFEEYLKYSGWTLDKDMATGVIAIRNDFDQNRLKVDRETSLVLFTLRFIYENENSKNSAANLGVGKNVYLTTPELMKFMVEYGITMQGKKLTGRGLGRCLRFANQHNIISKVSGTFDEGNVTFYILPSIAFAVDSQKIAAMSDALEKLRAMEGE